MTVALQTCVRVGCDYPIANDGAWAAYETPETCARHRQLERLRRGDCPNCGSAMHDEPIINAITGQPRTSAGRVPLMRRVCERDSCRYELRPQR
jgi:hypothetical protein